MVDTLIQTLTQMMRKITTAFLMLVVTLCAQAQWQSINPGAGGQVQDVICDPNVNQRLILASDMEGIYESLDNGLSWHPKGVLHQNRAFAVAIPKSSGNNTMYVGTMMGLERSHRWRKYFRAGEHHKTAIYSSYWCRSQQC